MAGLWEHGTQTKDESPPLEAQARLWQIATGPRLAKPSKDWTRQALTPMLSNRAKYRRVSRRPRQPNRMHHWLAEKGFC